MTPRQTVQRLVSDLFQSRSHRHVSEEICYLSAIASTPIGVKAKGAPASLTRTAAPQDRLGGGLNRADDKSLQLFTSLAGAEAIEFLSTPEARSRSYGANFRLPGFAPSGSVPAIPPQAPPGRRMQIESDKALPSSTPEEPRNLWLLITCVIGILIGLGVFGFVCYLLMK